jgi:Flp pilus assembly protein TadG
MLFAKKLMQFLRLHSLSDSAEDGRVGIFPNPNSVSAGKRFSARGHRIGTKPRHRRLGAATVELALVAPFILFIIFGSVEFARMMMVKQALTNAAREGCRHATLATIRDHDSAEAVVRDLLAGTVGDGQNTSIVRITITPEFHNSPTSGTEILTCVEVDCADISWLPATLFAGAKVRGVASMNRE